jgi:hypothetical protein
MIVPRRRRAETVLAGGRIAPPPEQPLRILQRRRPEPRRLGRTLL